MKTTTTAVESPFAHGTDEPVLEEVLDWELAHDRDYEKKAHERLKDLQDQWNGASNLERYELLQGYHLERGGDRVEHMNGGDAIKSAAISFEGLTTLAESTKSVYLRRYIDWMKNHEVHDVIGESLWQYVKVDTESPDYDVDKHKQLMNYFDGFSNDSPHDLPYRYTEEGELLVSAMPQQERALYDWGLKMIQEDPTTALDSNYYSPSPFKALIPEQSNAESFKKLAGKELELAIETLHLFGLSDIGLISSQARERLYYVGLNLDQSTYDRLYAVSSIGSERFKVVFAEAFLATEFGDDLGEQILQLAERGSENEMAIEQLGKVVNILKNVKRFTTGGILAEVDASMADDIRRGISTRTSEALYALNQRLTKGKNIDKPLAALAKVDEWANGVAEMLQRGAPQKVQETGDTKLYHFINPETGQKYPGAVELTTHGKFAEDATARERYVKEGRGARASFTYDADATELALSLKGSERRMAMNGRLDKSVYNARTKQSEPDAEKAEVSFDIASEHTPANSDSRIVAEVIAEGSAIRDTGNGRKGGAGNFTYDIIGQHYGKRDVFAGSVIALGDILDQRERAVRAKKVAPVAIAEALK